MAHLSGFFVIFWRICRGAFVGALLSGRFCRGAFVTGAIVGEPYQVYFPGHDLTVQTLCTSLHPRHVSPNPFVGLKVGKTELVCLERATGAVALQ